MLKKSDNTPKQYIKSSAAERVHSFSFSCYFDRLQNLYLLVCQFDLLSAGFMSSMRLLRDWLKSLRGLLLGKKSKENTREKLVEIDVYCPRGLWGGLWPHNWLISHLDLTWSRASCKTFKAKSTFSGVAFCPMRPILQTRPAVGPRPPAISSLYLGNEANSLLFREPL